MIKHKKTPQKKNVTSFPKAKQKYDTKCVQSSPCEHKIRSIRPQSDYEWQQQVAIC